jgi:hypothetical protein
LLDGLGELYHEKRTKIELDGYKDYEAGLPLSAKGRWLCCCMDFPIAAMLTLSVFYCWQTNEAKDQLVKVEKNAWHE